MKHKLPRIVRIVYKIFEKFPVTTLTTLLMIAGQLTKDDVNKQRINCKI